MKPELYDLNLGKQVVVIIQTESPARLEDISEKLKEHGASSILGNVFSLKPDGEDVASCIEKIVNTLDGPLGKGDTVLCIYGDGNKLSGRFVLVKEEKPGEGIRVAAAKH